MTLEHYVTLGRSGLRVSPLCLGTMTFGNPDWGTSATDAARIVDRYVDQGGNFVDTANNYSGGLSEKILGDHLAGHPSKRARLVLATKFFSTLFPGDPNAGGAGRKAIRSQLEGSLRRLRTDCVDLYWMHVWDRLTPLEETLRTLDDVVRDGLVRYVGFSNTPAWVTAEAQVRAQLAGGVPLVGVQLEYSLLERTIEGEAVPMAMAHGLGLTPWSPLKNGILTGKHVGGTIDRPFAAGALTDPHTARVLAAVRRMAGALDTTPARVALAWLLGRPGVCAPILGARTLAQLDDDLGALGIVLPAEHRADLDAVSAPSLPVPAAIVAFGGRVGYGGTTIDGTEYPATPYAPRSDADRY